MQIDQLRKENQRLLLALKQTQEAQLTSCATAMTAPPVPLSAMSSLVMSAATAPANIVPCDSISPPMAPVPLLKTSQSELPMSLPHLCEKDVGSDGEESEGSVEITLSKTSSLPVVTTRGPKPPLLTVEELQIGMKSKCMMC